MLSLVSGEGVVYIELDHSNPIWNTGEKVHRIIYVVGVNLSEPFAPLVYEWRSWRTVNVRFLGLNS